MTSSNGIPRISAASRSWRRWKVVQTLPRPRARAASMKLQAAGMIDPQREAWATTGAWSGAALHARDHVHRHLVDVVGQVADGIRDPGHPLVGIGRASCRER